MPRRGGEIVINYNTGQVSAFGFGGLQGGWNGGAQGSLYTGFVYGLNGDNSNYAGGFTGVSGSTEGVGGFAAKSSGGLVPHSGGIIPNGPVTVAGISASASLVPGATGTASVTQYFWTETARIAGSPNRIARANCDG